MKLLSKISLALLLSTACATAADDPFASLYSNTLVYTSSSDQTVSKVHPEKDGTWSSTSTDPKHPTSHGDWARLGGWLCSTNAETPKSKPWCRAATAHAIGDKWTETRPDKSVYQIELVAGR